MSLLFTPYSFQTPNGPVELPNRIVIAPMCQYSAVNGCATDWHLAHWANMLNSGAGMFIIEATAVSPEGRITPNCLGLWDDATAAALDEHLARASMIAPPMPVCIQLSHAGRKASSARPWDGGMLIPADRGGWTPLGPSALPHLPQEPAPRELTPDEIGRIKNDFVQAARRARAMGLQAIELHGAHGYLLHEFLSPLSNQRKDAYGGSFDNRIRFPLEVFCAVREVFGGVLGMLLSATDWVEGGWTVDETAELARVLTEAAQAEAVLQRGDADLVALGRAFLYQPRWGWQAAAQLQGQVQAHPPYWRSLPKEASGIFGPNARIGMR